MDFMNIGKTWLVYTQEYIPIQDGEAVIQKSCNFRVFLLSKMTRNDTVSASTNRAEGLRTT